GGRSGHAACFEPPQEQRPDRQRHRPAGDLCRTSASGRHRFASGDGAGITMSARTPVLIVGGGPVGLALAGELGWRGVECFLVEQTDGTIVTPKMNEVNVRTLWFCRRWGIADKVHNCPFPQSHARDAVFITSFTGHELG